jgi:hypothetical protein
MIQLVEQLLRKWGLVRPYSDDDLINASIEDKARDNEKIIERLQGALYRRIATNATLRESIKIAKRRTNSFEAFERHMLGRHDD